jgi:hypothetical protein
MDNDYIFLPLFGKEWTVTIVKSNGIPKTYQAGCSHIIQQSRLWRDKNTWIIIDGQEIPVDKVYDFFHAMLLPAPIANFF